jgi:ATP-dependent DNA ligase
VVDGEIVIARHGQLDFDALQMRLHPAASRVNKLSVEIPAGLVIFDLIGEGAEDMRNRPLAERRDRMKAAIRENQTVRITPASDDAQVAADWFTRFRGAGLDGVMAKPKAGVYEPGKRSWIKVKHQRTLDAVVVGFRWHKDGPGVEVGSLVLALFDEKGQLWPIGVAASFAKKKRAALLTELESWRDADAELPWTKWEGAEHRPDAGSRWSQGKDLRWEPLRLGLVAEVHTTQHDGLRLRHPAKLVRLRTDKPARECTTEQLKNAPAGEIGELFPG